jgi:hypothetical protein
MAKLTTIAEATTIYRELAAARPDAFRPDLATSLNNLSNRLAGLGRRGHRPARRAGHSIAGTLWPAIWVAAPNATTALCIE